MCIKDPKEASLIELAEYAVANKIYEKLEFAWWVPYAPKKRNIIIFKVKTKYRRTTHKYEVRIPNNVTEVMQINQEN